MRVICHTSDKPPAARPETAADQAASRMSMIQLGVRTPRPDIHAIAPAPHPRTQLRTPCSLSTPSQPSHHQGMITAPTRRALLATSLLIAAAAAPSAAEAASIKTVFVAGATGQTGSRVVAELRRRGYQVTAGVRTPSKATALGFDADPGIRVVRADVTEGVEALAQAIGDAQAVVCALGYNGGSDPQGFVEVDSKGTIALIAAAQQRGVSTFILESSVLTGANTLGPLARLGYAALNFGTNALDRKQEAEAALKAAAAASGGRLTYTIVRPAALTNEPEAEVGVPFTRPADSILGGGRVSRESVAELMVAALEQPGAANTTVEIASKKGGVKQSEAEWFAVVERVAAQR